MTEPMDLDSEQGFPVDEDIQENATDEKSDFDSQPDMVSSGQRDSIPMGPGFASPREIMDLDEKSDDEQDQEPYETLENSSDSTHALYGWGSFEPLLQILHPEDPNTPEFVRQASNNSTFHDLTVPPTSLIRAGFDGFDFDSATAMTTHLALWKRGKKKLYGWGDNQDNQIASGNEESILDPRSHEKFESLPVMEVACGDSHTAAVITYGGLYCFGSNEYGECGRHPDEEYKVEPHEVVPKMDKVKVCQVATGTNFTLALARNGLVYSFGKNDHGQLGRPTEGGSSVQGPAYEPRVVPALAFVPVIRIACGQSHAIAVSSNAQVFTWGRNRHGQLGLGHKNDCDTPTNLAMCNGWNISDVDCGSVHTMIVANHHDVYCFGQNNYGQCGRPLEMEEVVSPRRVQFEWGGEPLVSVSCGNYHNVATNGFKVWTWGNNTHGECLGKKNELETSAKDCFFTPQPVEWRSSPIDGCEKVIQVQGSRFNTFVISSSITDTAVEYSVSNRLEMPRFADWETMELLCDRANDQGAVEELFSLIKTVFSSPSAVNGSFKSLEAPTMMRMQSVAAPNESMLSVSVDFNRIRQLYDRLVNQMNTKIKNALYRALEELAKRADNFTVMSGHGPEAYRFYFILILFPAFLNGAFNHKVFRLLNSALARTKPQVKEGLIEWLSHIALEDLRCIVRQILECSAMYIELKEKVDDYIGFSTMCLDLFWKANEKRPQNDRLETQEFYNRALTRSSLIDLRHEYQRWVRNPNGFSFCHYPFIFDPVAKKQVLNIEQTAMQMQHAMAMNGNPMSLFFGGAQLVVPFFVLKVRRNFIVQDTLYQIAVSINENDRRTFKKPLRVQFHGEEAVDEGGVRKEFFQLIIRELFDEKYGCFVYNPDNRTYWFNKNSLENHDEFRLIGILLGLAIYNNTLLDIHLPRVLYKKLCKQRLARTDLYSLDEDLGRSVDNVLNYDGDVSDLGLVFAVDYMFYGEQKSDDLKENGGDIEVTNENRVEWSKAFAKYYLIESIRHQYDSFAQGFYSVMDGKAFFSMFKHAEELEKLICGEPHLDFHALEVGCDYKNGYHPEHRAIRMFWDIVHNMTEEQKRKFLLFVTGCDRAPLQGLNKLQFLIQRVGTDPYDGDSLPVAHTCFNLLDLPAYPTYEMMQEKLLIAIEYSEGFGLR